MGRAVHFIVSDDEFIADSKAKEIFENLSKDVFDDMSKEIIQASANNTSEAVSICNNVMESSRTLSLFGGKKVIWMRGLNFLNDGRVGKAKDTQESLEKFVSNLANLDENQVSLIISASPVDRRKKILKSLQSIADTQDFKSSNAAEACISAIESESKKLGISINPDAVEILISTVASSPRMALQELIKLATYKNFSGVITVDDVVELTPIFGEGDFFEITNAFYSSSIVNSLEILHRYFFTNKNASARPIISALQKQNSLIIQLRAIIDDNKIPRSNYGISKNQFESLYSKYSHLFEETEKSSYNVFSQNAWYAGQKLGVIAMKFSLKKLLDIQMNLIDAFESLLIPNVDEESVMKELFIKSI